MILNIAPLSCTLVFTDLILQAMSMGVALTPARYLENEEHDLPLPR